MPVSVALAEFQFLLFISIIRERECVGVGGERVQYSGRRNALKIFKPDG